MILCLDTSSLVKLYVDEVHSLAAALDLRRQAEGVAVTFSAFDVRLTQAAQAEGFQAMDDGGG